MKLYYRLPQPETLFTGSPPLETTIRSFGSMFTEGKIMGM